VQDSDLALPWTRCASPFVTEPFDIDRFSVIDLVFDPPLVSLPSYSSRHRLRQLWLPLLLQVYHFLISGDCDRAIEPPLALNSCLRRAGPSVTAEDHCACPIFCENDDILANIERAPVPHDRRCGCVFCPGIPLSPSYTLILDFKISIYSQPFSETYHKWLQLTLNTKCIHKFQHFFRHRVQIVGARFSPRARAKKWSSRCPAQTVTALASCASEL